MIGENLDTDICYVISHGFAARMLLQTGLIQRLADAGNKIAIISPDITDPNLSSLADNPMIALYDPNIKQTIWDDDYAFRRIYYTEDFNNNPVFWEKHLYSIFYSKSKHPWKRLGPIYYYFIYKLIKIFPNIRTRFKQTEGKYLKSLKAYDLVEKINPKLVVSTYPINFLESKILHAAKEQGRGTLIHLLSWDNITSKGIFPVIPDHFIAWGQVMLDELKAYYKVKDDQVNICGVPHFDHHIKVKNNPNFEPLLRNLGLQPTLPYLFFAMSSPRFAPHEINILEWLAEEVNTGRFGSELQLVVRPHPQNVQGALADKKWIKRLDRLQEGRVAVDYPSLNKSKVRWSMKQSDMDHLSNLLAGCSICINSGSTVSIDALVMGKPVILTSFDGHKQLHYWKSARRLIDYTHQKKFVALGGAEPVFNYGEFSDLIKKYLDNPARRIEERKHALQMECHATDGMATERSVCAMKSILANQNKVDG